jgi:hypothetical protein
MRARWDLLADTAQGPPFSLECVDLQKLCIGKPVLDGFQSLFRLCQVHIYRLRAASAIHPLIDHPVAGNGPSHRY